MEESYGKINAIFRISDIPRSIAKRSRLRFSKDYLSLQGSVNSPARGKYKNNVSAACNNVNTFIGYRFRSTCTASFITGVYIGIRDPRLIAAKSKSRH